MTTRCFKIGEGEVGNQEIHLERAILTMWSFHTSPGKDGSMKPLRFNDALETNQNQEI